MKCVISGSFRKFYKEIVWVIEEFEKCGIEVISPKKSKILNAKDGFVFLATDETNDIKMLEEKHLQEIEKSDFLYIYNPVGYIGKSVAFELGWAVALKKPIYSQEKPDDVVLAQFTEVKSIREICKKCEVS
jgi:nucleoside 2-deoxyribosyltransferase